MEENIENKDLKFMFPDREPVELNNSPFPILPSVGEIMTWNGKDYEVDRISHIIENNQFKQSIIYLR